MVERLVMGVAPWAWFTHTVQPNDNIVPTIVYATLTPKQMFRADARAVYGLQKCIGYVPRRPEHVIGAIISTDDADVHWFDRPMLKKPRRKRPLRVAAA